MVRLGIIGEEQREIIAYGLDLFLFSLLSFVSLLLLGITIGMGRFTLILLLTFIPLQSFGGGYHCKTHLRCWTMMLTVLLTAILIQMRLTLFTLWCTAFVSAFPILSLAPVQHANAPFSVSFSVRMRRNVKITYGAAVLSSLTFSALAGPILLGVSLSGVSIICASIQAVWRAGMD